MRQWLTSWWHTPGRYSRPILAGVLVLAVVGAALGTGYATTKAVAGDDSAWLQKGDTVVQINGPSGRVDAVVANHPVALAANLKNQLEVIEDPNGQVYVADASSHHVYEIDLNTMEPQSLGSPGTAVLAAADAHYVVDASSGVVRQFDPQTLALSAPLTIPGGIASSAIAPNGAAYIGSNNGSITEVSNGRPQTFNIAGKGQQMDVSVVGSRPVAVDVTDGQVHLLSNTGATNGPIISLPGITGSTVEVASSLSAGNLWLIRGTQLEQVNLSTTQTSVVSLPHDDDYGAPVTNDGDAYVPDETANTVLVYDPLMGLLKTVSIPSGRAGMDGIELVVRDGAVWADDPSSSEATVISSNGSTETVEKGTGDGVVAPGTGTPKAAKHPTAKPPAKSAGTHSPTPPPPVPTTSAVTTPPVTVPVSPANPVTNPPVTIPPVTTPPIHSTPPTTVKGPSTTTSSAPPTTAQPQVKVPTDLVGQSIQAACADLSKLQLVCNETNQGEAPDGQQPDVVTKVPDAGQTVPTKTKVEIAYYGTAYATTVPQPGSDTYDAYCTAVDQAGLTCAPDDLGVPPNGGALYSLGTITPAPGSAEAPGTAVAIDYYGLVPAPNCGGDPADAAGTSCTDGPYSSDISFVTAPSSTASDVACNTVWTQSPAASTAMTPGSALTVYYDSNCSTPIYEWAICGARYHFISVTNNSPPPGTTETSAGCTASNMGDWYPFTLATQGGSNQLGVVYPAGTQKAGTRPVYQFTYAEGSCQQGTSGITGGGCIDYDYSIDANAELASGWSAGAVAFYVSQSTGDPGGGLIPISAAQLSPWGTPGPRGWYTYDYCADVSTSNCYGQPYPAWDIYSV
jgi:hypothetical protein